MSADDLTPRAETPAETMERLGWTSYERDLILAPVVRSDRGIRWNVGLLWAAVVNTVNEQVGGGDLASLADRLDDVTGWQEGILGRLGATKEMVDSLCNAVGNAEIRLNRLERVEVTEPPQTAAERRTGQKLLDMVRPGWRERLAARLEGYAADTVAYEREHLDGDLRHAAHTIRGDGETIAMLRTAPALTREAALEMLRIAPAAPALPVEGEREELAALVDEEADHYEDIARSDEEDAHAEKLRRAAALLRALPAEAKEERTRAYMIRGAAEDVVRSALDMGGHRRVPPWAFEALAGALVGAEPSEPPPAPASVGTAWTEGELAAVRDGLRLVAGETLPRVLTDTDAANARSALARLERGEAPPGLRAAVEAKLAGVAGWRGARGAVFREGFVEALTWVLAEITQRGEAPAVGAETVAWRDRFKVPGAAWRNAWGLHFSDPTLPGLTGGWEQEVQPLGVIGPVKEPK